MGIEPTPPPYFLLDWCKDPIERRRVYMKIRSGMMDQAKRAGTPRLPWPVKELLAECKTEVERREVLDIIAADDERRAAGVPQGWVPFSGPASWVMAVAGLAAAGLFIWLIAGGR